MHAQTCLRISNSTGLLLRVLFSNIKHCVLQALCFSTVAMSFANLIARVTAFQAELWIEAAVGRLCVTAEVVEGRHCMSAGFCGSVMVLFMESQFLWMPAVPARRWKSLEDVSRSFYRTAWSLVPSTKEQLENRYTSHPWVQLLKITLDRG